MQKKKPTTNKNKSVAGRKSKTQPNYIDIDPCTEGSDCFEGDQKTFITPFELSELRLPTDRLTLWVAQELALNPAGMNQDWWTAMCGSKEVRPVIKRLRDSGWPIQDVYEHHPTPRLPGRHIKCWYLTPEHRTPILALMDKAGLIEGAHQ
jgi:hypothetical protein